MVRRGHSPLFELSEALQRWPSEASEVPLVSRRRRHRTLVSLIPALVTLWLVGFLVFCPLARLTRHGVTFSISSSPARYRSNLVRSKGIGAHLAMVPNEQVGSASETARSAFPVARLQPRLPNPRAQQIVQQRFSLREFLGASVTSGFVAVRRIMQHRIRVPAQRAQSPAAEILFGLAVYGTIRTALHSYVDATNEFSLRDDLFREMAVAHTYKNSVGPWIQTGVIAVIASTFIVLGVRAFIRSMKEWEHRQEMKEMSQLGDDALFLMSTPVDAVPLEKQKDRMRRRLTPFPVRALRAVLDFFWLFRIGACVGYLLPLLNVLDFGEISISLYPHALGVPPSEPIVNFLQNTLKLRFLHSAYLKSGYYFLFVWFLFIQLTVRNKAAPFFLRFHSSQAILISMLLGVPQQIFFAVLNPWEAGLVVQKIMYHSMVSIFLFVLGLLSWCCINALLKRTMKMPLVSEAAEMWAGKE